MTAPSVVGGKGPVRLGQLLGKGGEGRIYEVDGQPAVVAKLYLKDIPPEHAEKLGVMLQLVTPKLASLTAWPIDLLKASGGKVVGFLMPKITAHDVHKIYGPKNRQQILPQADWRFLVRVALNTARAFAVVHEAGLLVGDVNHGGVMVSADATVRLIDCDSFQITKGTKTFLCEVGVEEFTPPELQGRSFRGVTRTANHDNFGLAVLIFQLLMLGRHPFAGRHQGKGDLSIGEAIAQFKYVYSRDRARTLMEPPPFAASELVAGPEIAQLWEQAFGPAGKQPSGRPTAEQWVFALQKLEGNFAKCPNHAGHYFARGIPCPWCVIERGIGWAPFPLPNWHMQPIHTGGPFSLQAVWAQISSVPPPPSTQPAQVPKSRPPVSQEAASYAVKKAFYKGLALAGSLGAFIGGLTMGVAWIACAFAALGAYAILLAFVPSDERILYLPRKNRAQNELKSLLDRWSKEATGLAFEAKLNELHRKRSEYQDLSNARETEYQKLVSNRKSVAKKKFLDTFLIAHASISGIGPAKTAMLESYGIETAADITKSAVMNVPGFGPAMTARLLEWRRSVEAKFRFDPKVGVDPQAVFDLDKRIAEQRRVLEDALRKGASELNALRTSILTQRRALEEPIFVAVQTLAQAEVDLEAVK